MLSVHGTINECVTLATYFIRCSVAIRIQSSLFDFEKLLHSVWLQNFLFFQFASSFTDNASIICRNRQPILCYFRPSSLLYCWWYLSFTFFTSFICTMLLWTQCDHDLARLVCWKSEYLKLCRIQVTSRHKWGIGLYMKTWRFYEIQVYFDPFRVAQRERYQNSMKTAFRNLCTDPIWQSVDLELV